MSDGNKVAVVTGASRGIGRGCALELASAGFDVVLCARTVREGDQFEHSSSVTRSDTSPLWGSLERTAAEVEALGRRALQVKLDLNVLTDIEAVAKRTLETFGRVDVLVNNARYIGPGHMDPFLETPIEILAAHDRCNVIGPLYLTQLLVPKMAEQGGGIVFNLSSLSGAQETAAPVGNGGWGLGYSISKAGINRAAAGLAKELKAYNIAVINIEPGLVTTERVAADQTKLDDTRERMEIRRGGNLALPSNTPGVCIAHIARHKYPMVFSGRAIESFTYIVEHELVDAQELSALYGPAAWGVPMPFRLMPERVVGWMGSI